MSAAGEAFDVVIGALGYSGRFIAQRLMSAGRRVVSLTNSPSKPNPFGPELELRPLRFENVDELAESMRGGQVLYNTYWVRYDQRDPGFARAVENSRRLVQAAVAAGIRRIVHSSITNPSLDSPYGYFRGKAEVEEIIKVSGLSYAILRPAVLFGDGGVLINNIAWMLRRLPVFGMFGRGTYRLQPIHVDDYAALAVEQGGGRENVVIDAVGPETFTYRDLLKLLCRVMGLHRLILPLPPAAAWPGVWLMGKVVGDTIVTREEIAALMGDLLCTDSPPAGQIKLSDHLRDHAETLGRHYHNDKR